MRGWVAIAVAILSSSVVASSGAQQQPVNIAVSGGPDELTIEAGAAASTSFIVRNPSDHPQDVEIEVTGLTIVDGDYSMTGEPPRGMSVGIDPVSFSVAPQGAQDVSVRVSMAADAEPGGNYAGIVVRGLPEAQAGGSPVTGEIAVPLLVTVPGDVIESGELLAFQPADRTVEIGDEAVFRIAFANTGTVHYPLRGVVQLFDGPRPLGVVDVPGAPVLPGSTRDVEVRWVAVAPKGEVRAVAQLTWGKEGQLNGSRETTIELVVDDTAGDADGSAVEVSRRPATRSVAVQAGLALALLVLMLALLFRWALQRKAR